MPLRATATQHAAVCVVGNDAVGQDRKWLTTLDRMQSVQREQANPLRPTPQTARLAYMMLAQMGA